MNDLKGTIANRLKVARAKANMTQAELAKKSGVSVATIAKTEQKASSPSFETAYVLADALGCTPNYLCGLEPR